LEITTWKELAGKIRVRSVILVKDRDPVLKVVSTTFLSAKISQGLLNLNT